ncbi:peptidylprolyl isomerase [Parastagonospora nodorum]|nr:peptidylprolyl isomerase [Parastagonospora nodorum]
MSNMARYTVKFVAGERKGSFLVPLSPTQPCSSLIDAVKNRLFSLKGQEELAGIKDADATLHLEDADGPMLYPGDALQDVLPGAKEIVVIVFEALQAFTTHLPHQNSQSPNGSLPANVPSLKIRVVSPESARNSRIDRIDLLPDVIPLTCTLTDLKARVQVHLGFPANDGICPDLACNCMLAQKIDEHAVLGEDYEAARTAIIVHGSHDILAVPVDGPYTSHFEEAAQELMQPNKVLTFIGGVALPTQSDDNKQYIKAPVLAICSKRRHAAHDPTSANTVFNGRELIVELHTSECPIDVTEHNGSVTLAEAGLEDCAVDGILTVYAVQRWTDPQEELADGKAGIFQRSAAWEHPHGQSDRGISNLLSTLRVFTNLTSGRAMEDERQDAVLHMIYLLTQFPPAVRAIYILMRGETPPSAERAALAQSIYEVLKSVVPLRVVGSDPLRFFEGSRLLFGLILEKAKNLKITNANNATSLPYVGMSVYDLRNMITMEPILSVPVQTKAGLLEPGLFGAFKQGGFLTWTNFNNTARSSMLDGAWSRMAALSGGTKAQTLRFNLDAVNTSVRYLDCGDVNQIIASAEYSELSYLAGLCARNQLSVIPPSELPSATPPVLTLDREGSLAVYIGRAACGEPGKDILLFRPTSSREEDGVDVSIITQVLEPILAQRKADGTAIFEAFGDQHRKLVAPDEIAVICVDLSRSMDDRCGFVDVQDNEDANTQSSPSQDAVISATVTENPAFHLPDADELKEYIRNHESFDDFVAITRAGTNDNQRRRNAEKVLQIIQQFDTLQIEAKTKELEKLRQTSHYHYRTRVNDIELELNTVKNRSLRLTTYKALICAWLLTSLGPEDAFADPLAWRPGQPIPRVPKKSHQEATAGPKFHISREYCCHISSEIMEDPVITEDNFTYERKNIERWFQSNETSPLTNLVLSNLNLRPDLPMKDAIAQFLSGEDITSNYQALPGDAHLMRVSLRSPLDTWSLLLPRKLKLLELWELAFRLTKGRYHSFELQYRNARLATSETTISTALGVGQPVFITPADSQTISTATTGDMQEICLVKVYKRFSGQMILSYWEPTNTTRSVGSAVFKYYRAKFAANSSAAVDGPFVLWTGLEDVGDGAVCGTVLESPSNTLSKYFNEHMSTGILTEEPCIAKVKDDTKDDVAAREGRDITQPLVFKLTLGNAPSSLEIKRNRLSRLDVLKQMFDAYINRLLAYNFQTHLGLVTFGSKASIAQPITNAVENFRHKLNNMQAKGDTAMWDSIALAQDQLQAYAEKYPSAKLRIICISDGEDNKSQQDMVNIAFRLHQQEIILDAFCLGDTSNVDLQTVSYLTQGYAFHPQTLEEAMTICELEPVLSSLERAKPQEKRSRYADSYYYRDAFHVYPTLSRFRMANEEVIVEHVSKDDFTKRKEHPQLADEFVELGTFSKHSTQARTDGNLRLSRVHTEIRNSGAHKHPHYDIYINESNMAFWKVVMQGPPESTYAGGTFLLYIDMGADYPMFAPTARFVTPIYHPNINRHGRICHSILDRNWTVDTSNKDLLDTIYSLLLVPEFSDPINTVVTLNYHWDEVQFKEEAQRHIQKHASKSRAEWRAEIVG